MRLTRESEIAVHTLLACAARPNEMVQTREVAEASGATKDYSAHVVARLVRAGFLRSYRGRMGGLQLARQPGDIAIGAVMRVMQPTLASRRKRGRPAAPSARTAFDAVMRVATDSFLATLDDFTLADLAAGMGTGRLVCLDCDLKTTALALRARARKMSGVAREPSAPGRGPTRERTLQHVWC